MVSRRRSGGSPICTVTWPSERRISTPSSASASATRMRAAISGDLAGRGAALVGVAAGWARGGGVAEDGAQGLQGPLDLGPADVAKVPDAEVAVPPVLLPGGQDDVVLLAQASVDRLHVH